MKIIFHYVFAIIVILQPYLFGEVTTWQKAQLERELESIGSNIPSPKMIRAAYMPVKHLVTKGCNSLRIYHVEIHDDQSIYIDGINVENLRKLKVLSQLKNIPILVGTKHLQTNAKQILFIEECSTVDRKSAYYSWWDASKVYKEVKANRDQFLWSQKIPQLVWRGYLSDEIHSCPALLQGKTYELSPRMILHALGNVHPQLIDAKLTNVNVSTALYLSCLDISPLFFPNKENHNEIGPNETIQLHPRMSVAEQLKYRYQIALDGIHAANPGYAWRLLSGCLVFKQESPYIQWFYAGLLPGVHYISVKNGLENLMTQLQWAIEHDSEAEEIGRNSRAFAENHLEIDQFMEQAHFVLEEYARLQKISP